VRVHAAMDVLGEEATNTSAAGVEQSRPDGAEAIPAACDWEAQAAFVMEELQTNVSR